MPSELLNATFLVEGESQPIKVQFNPTELNFSKSVQIAEIAIPGLDAPIQQFIRGQAEKLTLELFFDTTESGIDAGATSVTTRTDKFYSLLKIQPETHAPPICEFHWNSQNFPGVHLPPEYAGQQRHSFKCIVEGVSQKFTLFSPQGIPLRATLTVTLREYRPLEQQLKELKLESPDHTKSYVVQRGDTLSSIANKTYGTPVEWRRMAIHNSITDPRRLTPGRNLEVPPIL